jgi:hypothetical protein
MTDINITQYTQFDKLIDGIYENIRSLNQIHKFLLEESNKKTLPYEYTVYIDDLFFQKNLLSKESEHLLTVKQMSLRRFYASLFRLYQHIIGTYINLLKNKKIGGFGTPEHMRIFYDDPRIRIYNELDIITLYRYADIENITMFIRHYLELIKKQMQVMDAEIAELHRKKDIGFQVNSVLWAYQNERRKLECDITAFQQLFESITLANRIVVKRFIDRAIELKNEINHHSPSNSVSSLSGVSSIPSTIVADVIPNSVITLEINKVSVEDDTSNDIEDNKSVVDEMNRLIAETESVPTTPIFRPEAEDEPDRISLAPIYNSDTDDE